MVRTLPDRPAPGGVPPVRSRRGWAAAASVITAAVLAWPAPASAEFQPQTHIDSLYPTANATWTCVDGVSGGATPTNLFCLTDNADTSWYTDSDNSNGSGDIRNRDTFELVLEREYDAKTALSMRYQPNPKFSGSGETDIIFQQGNTGPLLGITWCNDAVEGTRECDQQYVRFASHNPGQYLICHETGHAVGLTHGAQANPVQAQDEPLMDCMRTELPSVPGTTFAIIRATLTSQLTAHYQNQ
jgi:hypothetical protein